MPDLSDRIREAREALGLSQQAIAEMCGVTARSQRNYESGERMPDAAYLSAIAAAGADVRYILTGRRDGPAPVVLSAEEQTMVAYMREATPQLRKAALGVLLSGSAGGGNYSQQNSGANAVQIGAHSGKVKIIKGG